MNFFQKFRDFISRPTHSRTMGIVVILVLVSAVSLTVIAAQQQQQIRQRAIGNECASDYSSCDYEYAGCNRESCDNLAVPVAPNQADYQIDEEYGAAYDKYKTDYDEYTANYSNCTEQCRAIHETCKQNVYNTYLECSNKSISAPAITETPASTAPPAEVTNQSSQPTPTVPAVTVTPTTPPTNTFVSITQPAAAPTVSQSAIPSVQSPNNCTALQTDFDNLVQQYAEGNIDISELNNVVREYVRQGCH